MPPFLERLSFDVEGYRRFVHIKGDFEMRRL